MPGASEKGRGAPEIVRLGVVDSTQTVAFALAAEGAPDRTVVVADHQSRGRGRRARSWYDEPGASLLLSILVRPRLAFPLLPTLSLATGVAVAETLARSAGLAARLKWPNDVLVSGRKIAGVLLESRIDGAEPPSVAPSDVGAERPATVAVGVGINVAQTRFPPELEDTATSVARERGRPVDRDTLLATLLEAFDAWRGRLEAAGFEPVRQRWLELADTLGRRVILGGVTATAVGLDVDGALLVSDGRVVHRMVSAEVT